jgi:hypothetical protein
MEPSTGNISRHRDTMKKKQKKQKKKKKAK